MFMASELPPIEASVRRLANRLAPPLGAACLYAVRGGGKRIRPLLVVASFEAAGAPQRRLDSPPYSLAAAVELIHTYSLLHDDLPCMDDDDLRRGRPAVHRIYGTGVAVATGLALQQLAFDVVAEELEGTPVAGEAIRRLAHAAGGEGMVGGQALDLEAEATDLDPAGLEAIHRAKTAALMSGACALGAAASAADDRVVAALTAYGENLGLAFQIVDDLLDVIADTDAIGKRSGADARRSKATYPGMHGVEAARGQAHRAGEQALEALSEIPGDRGVLAAFVDYVLDRVS